MFMIGCCKARWQGWIGALLLAALTGCRTVPFDETPRVSTRAWDAETVRAEFADRLPPRFEWRHAMTFEFPFFKMSALGIAAGDRVAQTFTLVCFTHTGVTLFEMQGDGESVQARFTIPEMAARPEMGEAIAEDARRMFFNLAPSANARVRRRRQKLVFVEEAASGRVEYDFGGDDRVLLEKRYRRGWRKRATVRYFEYGEDDGFLRPRGIVLRNHERKYQLVFRAL